MLLDWRTRRSEPRAGPGAALHAMGLASEEPCVHEPAVRWHMQAPQLRRPWMLGWAPQVPSSQLRGRGWWTVCASCSAAAGICCGLFLWQRSSGGGQPSRLRSPRGHHLLAPCAPPALSAACTVGRCCSLCASAGCRHSRSGASTGPRRLRPRCRPGRWGTGSLPLPQLAPSAAAGCCCPSQQSCSPPGVPQSAMT